MAGTRRASASVQTWAAPPPMRSVGCWLFFFFQAEDGIRDDLVTGVQTCALPIYKALLALEVDAAGMDAMDRRYLNVIALNYGGGPVGVETIAAALSEPRDAIEEIIEPYLIQRGFLQRTPRGRALTGHAFKHLGLAEPSRDPAQLGLFNSEDEA